MNLPQVSNEFAFWFFILVLLTFTGALLYDFYRDKDKKIGKNH